MFNVFQFFVQMFNIKLLTFLWSKYQIQKFSKYHVWTFLWTNYNYESPDVTPAEF